MSPTLHPDQALIADWIKPGSRILDLVCGDGRLLAALSQARDVSGYGIEIDPPNIHDFCSRSRFSVSAAIVAYISLRFTSSVYI